MGLSELALHLLEARLPQPVLWGADESSAKVAQVTGLARDGLAEVDVLILGPSHASLGISPHNMMKDAPEFGWSVYNGGVNGRTYSAIEFILAHVYGPLLKPKLLVLTASPIIFTRSNTRMERNSDEFFDAPMPRALRAQGWEGAFRRFLAERFYLYRYRKTQVGLEKGIIDHKRVIDHWGYGGRPGFYNEVRRSELLQAHHPYREVIANFAFGGPSLESFLRIVDESNRLRVPVVVVNMPFREDLFLLASHAREDYRTYLGEMARLAARHGFSWLDYQESLSLEDNDFRDVDHLNYSGTRKLSLRLASDLRPLLKQVVPSPSPVRRPSSPRTKRRAGS